MIAASSGMAAAIAAELLARKPNGVAGVRLQTINDLARRIVNDAGEYPRVASDAERRLARRTAARAIDDPMMESRGMAAMLERSYRDVRDSGVTLADFDARARRATLRNARRTQLVVRAWREYERLIAQTGAIDPADLLGRAAALAARLELPPQIVAGFYDMTGAQLALVEALPVAAIFIPAGEGDEYAFARPLIARFGGAEGAHRAPLPDVRVTAHETKLDELRAVCAEVRALLDHGVAPREIAIVARTLDDDDARLLQRFSAELGFATTATTATPLLAHRLGRGLATLLRLREHGFPRGDVFELLRDGFRPKQRMTIDDVDLATRRARVAGGMASELQNVAHKPMLDDYVAVVEELEQLAPPAVLRGSEWSDKLSSLASRFRLETDLDIEAANAIDDVCALLRRWPSTRFDTSIVIDAIEQHEIGGAATGGVITSDVMSFRGRSVAHLFAVRMQDDLFPQRRVDDPLVPDADRRALGLRQIGDGRDEERLLFELLFDAAETSIRFSYASGDGFGKVLRKSPFLRGRTLCAPTTRPGRGA
ncbi:MAG TPA: hypothetical protein VJZ76_19880, partial [Thermoanaerobaculia bacterium]|nr:hypothetical protein [Thermoanaerobaculia bacterium]